jgi:2-dehydro-3-deoxyphosphogluconate aldolase / (4S)-4-hydroxy-2-oxoglutarate aldolase
MDGPVTALDRIAAAGVVAVVTIDDPAAAAPLGAALAAGGLPCVEVTFRTTAAEQSIAQLAADRGVVVGAGTVLEPSQVDRAVGAGARFIVSPGFDRRVVDRCRVLEVPVVPGLATATEAMAALHAGVGVVKLFPAGPLGGLAMVRAMAAPFPELRFLPTGGIGERDVSGYVAHPAVVAVGGSWVADRALVSERRFDEVERRARAAAELVREARRGAV